MLSLIYFLRKKNKFNRFSFFNALNRIKNRLNMLNSDSSSNLHELIRYRLLKSLSYKYLFINLFSSINVISNKFILNRYLVLLDNFRLLRFNYKFSMYKQLFLLHFNDNHRSQKYLKGSKHFIKFKKEKNRYRFINSRKNISQSHNSFHSLLNPYFLSKQNRHNFSRFNSIFNLKLSRISLKNNSFSLLTNRSLTKDLNFYIKKNLKIVKNKLLYLKSFSNFSFFLNYLTEYNYKIVNKSKFVSLNPINVSDHFFDLSSALQYKNFIYYFVSSSIPLFKEYLMLYFVIKKYISLLIFKDLLNSPSITNELDLFSYIKTLSNFSLIYSKKLYYLLNKFFFLHNRVYLHLLVDASSSINLNLNLNLNLSNVTQHLNLYDSFSIFQGDNKAIFNLFFIQFNLLLTQEFS